MWQPFILKVEAKCLLIYVCVNRQNDAGDTVKSALDSCGTMYVFPIKTKRKCDSNIKTVKPVLDEAADCIRAQRDEISRLVRVASQHPFYKYNGVWTRELQNLVSSDHIPSVSAIFDDAREM